MFAGNEERYYSPHRSIISRCASPLENLHFLKCACFGLEYLPRDECVRSVSWKTFCPLDVFMRIEFVFAIGARPNWVSLFLSAVEVGGSHRRESRSVSFRELPRASKGSQTPFGHSRNFGEVSSPGKPLSSCSSWEERASDLRGKPWEEKKVFHETSSAGRYSRMKQAHFKKWRFSRGEAHLEIIVRCVGHCTIASFRPGNSK